MLIDDEGDRFAPLAEILYVNLIRHARIHTSINWNTSNKIEPNSGLLYLSR